MDAHQPPHPVTTHPSNLPFAIHGLQDTTDAANQINTDIGPQSGFTILPPIDTRTSNAQAGLAGAALALHAGNEVEARRVNTKGDEGKLNEGDLSSSPQRAPALVAASTSSGAASPAVLSAATATPMAIANAIAAGDATRGGRAVPAMMSPGLLRELKKAHGGSKECRVTFADGVWTAAEL